MLKEVVRIIHLWLGLISGIVVFFVSITGCILVFDTEINKLLETGVWVQVEEQDLPHLSPLEIEERIKILHTGEIEDLNASVFFNENWATICWVEGLKHDYTAYIINPYTGTVLKQFSYGVTFWAVITYIHGSMAIPAIGHHIVAASTFIFFVLLLSGLVLWFPSKKNKLKGSFKVRWNANPKRLIYDLHNILGFYATWILIFVCITALAMSYKWVDNAIYRLASGKAQPELVQSNTSHIQKTNAVDVDVENSITQVLQSYKNISSYYIIYPANNPQTYKLHIQTLKGENYNRKDYFELNASTGTLVKSMLWSDKNLGEVIHNMNLAIHTGSALGLLGQLLAFFSSLIAASLPITGLLMWLRRRKEKKAFLKNMAAS